MLPAFSCLMRALLFVFLLVLCTDALHPHHHHDHFHRQTTIFASSRNQGSKKKSKHKIRSNDAAADTVSRKRAAGEATDRPIASIAGVSEDHRFEQFYYDKDTQQRIFRIMQRFEHPLLLCNPSLAVMADKAGLDYQLLDRDRRFSFLKGYREFSIMEPHLVEYPYDSVFVDPPFANVTPLELRRCLDLMAPDEHRRSEVPLFVAYNSKRELPLLAAFEARQPLEKKWSLRYMSVTDNMQDNIYLYASKSFLC